MPTTLHDDILAALEETAAEQFADPERCGLLLAAHNRLVRQEERDQEEIRIHAALKIANAQQAAGGQPPGPISPHEQVFVMPPAAEIDNREDPEE